ncbi:hypothetical protein SAMCCGM7_pC2075 (plasmid) [Sinorhizobium americanum CCGM7]|nr:hypothetical protein SAMCCGM7_pC2075 [Sinorhizobium americanum CCGM7]
MACSIAARRDDHEAVCRHRYIAKMLAELRWSTSEDYYLSQIREMFAPPVKTIAA